MECILLYPFQNFNLDPSLLNLSCNLHLPRERDSDSRFDKQATTLHFFVIHLSCCRHFDCCQNVTLPDMRQDIKLSQRICQAYKKRLKFGLRALSKLIRFIVELCSNVKYTIICLICNLNRLPRINPFRIRT